MTVNTATPDYIVDGVLTDGEAWVPLVTNVLAADAATVTFQSSTGANDWSQYMDLVIIAYVRNGRADTGGAPAAMNFNNDTGANYSYQTFSGNGSTTSAATSTTTTYSPIGNVPKDNDTANAFAAILIDLFDINSGKYKTSIVQNSQDRNGAGDLQMISATWRNQAPITEIDFKASLFGYDINAGSRFDLFGVLPRMVTA
jgi:hypothetical protein